MKRFELFTNHLTPNGLKVSIYLEELKASSNPALDYDATAVDLAKGFHKEAWFTDMNPNGRIPVLIDNSCNFTVFESSAILMYLEQNVDTRKSFSFDMNKSPNEYSSMYQWIFFGHGGISPMQSQSHYFLHYSPEDVPFAVARFCEETKRLYSVLDTGLNRREWLAGDRYTIADISIFPWIRLHTRAGIQSLDPWPNLKAWYQRISERAAVRSAIRNLPTKLQAVAT